MHLFYPVALVWTWKAGGNQTDGMRRMMLRYAAMICDAMDQFRRSSWCNPSATNGPWHNTTESSAKQHKHSTIQSEHIGSFAFTVFPQPHEWRSQKSSRQPPRLPWIIMEVGYWWMMVDASSLCNLCHARCWGCSSDALLSQPSYAKNVRPKRLVSSRDFHMNCRKTEKRTSDLSASNWSLCRLSPVLRLQSLDCFQSNTLPW